MDSCSTICLKACLSYDVKVNRNDKWGIITSHEKQFVLPDYFRFEEKDKYPRIIPITPFKLLMEGEKNTSIDDNTVTKINNFIINKSNRFYIRKPIN